MVSTLAGIGVALSGAASVAAFIRSAVRGNKRPTIWSILVALCVVPFVAAAVSGLTAVPLELLGRVPSLSIFAWLVATAILMALCAIGGHFLALVMGEHKGPQAGDVMRGEQLSMADRWQKAHATDAGEGRWRRFIGEVGNRPRRRAQALLNDGLDQNGQVGRDPQNDARRRGPRRSGDHRRSGWRVPVTLLRSCPW